MMTIELIKSLRKELHKHPELSGQEAETAGRIKRFIKKYDDAKIVENIGGHGLAVCHFRVFKYGPNYFNSL